MKSGVKSISYAVDWPVCIIDYCWFYQFTYLHIWNAHKYTQYIVSWSQVVPEMLLQFLSIFLEKKTAWIIYTLRYRSNVCVEKMWATNNFYFLYVHHLHVLCQLSHNIGSLLDINWWYIKMESIEKGVQCLSKIRHNRPFFWWRENK